jgi:Tfp pilus assembly protein PilX
VIGGRLRAMRSDDSGAAIVLALLFVLVVGLLGGAMASFATSSLGQTSVLQSNRSLIYSAESGVDVAILKVRSLTTQATAPGYGSACPTTSQPVYGAGSDGAALTGKTVSVTCAVTFPAPFVRNIQFTAAVAGTTIVDVRTTFVDVDTADGCTQVTSTNGHYNSPCYAPASSVSVGSWDIPGSDN